MRRIPICLAMAALLGCTPTVEKRFVPTPGAGADPGAADAAAVDPVPREAVRIERLGDGDVEGVRALRHAGARVLGRSSFVQEERSEKAVRDFAASIGSDVVLWGQRYHGRRIDPSPNGAVRATRVPGDDGVIAPVRVPRTQTRGVYEHELVFLRTEP